MQASESRYSDMTDLRQDPTFREATFAAGCFWGVERAFRQVPGVVEVVSGYTGGHTSNPTYEQVCTGSTGHAEAVLVTYNPAIVSYETLLHVFWSIHDPTQLNRQGPDIGTQYRSAIFYHDEEQRTRAESSMRELEESGRLRSAVVTELTLAGPFWRAEEYHQRYLDKSRRGAE